MKKLFVVFVLIVVVILGAKLGVSLYLDQKVLIQAPKIFLVAKGDSLSKVSRQLHQAGIIRQPKVFLKLGQLYGYDKKLRYGEYQILASDTHQDVFNKIVSGKNYRYKITFVEGDHHYRYAQQVEEMGLGSAKDFLKVSRDPMVIKSLLGVRIKNLEGYLFPDTYSFAKTDGVSTIIKTMVKRLLSQTTSLDLKNQKMTRHEIITLASIIEKETGAIHERSLISSVFHNRLKKKMRLQTDPTIIYGILDKTGIETKNIRRRDITAKTSYNTYVINGLPPGPIANPGIESIRAAIQPENTEYLFFVSQNDGTHVFTKSYKAHLRAVKKYQLNPKMREGRSWRDLNKKKGVGQ